ncbi:ABC transporter ATP-binding protein [Pseudochelatococcus sp. B33]
MMSSLTLLRSHVLPLGGRLRRAMFPATKASGTPSRDTEANAPMPMLSVMRFIAGYWRRRARLFLTGLAVSLLATVFDLALPWASAALVDAIASGPSSVEDVWHAWVIFIAMFLGFALARNLAHRLWIPVAARNMEELANETFAKVQTLPAAWHASAFAGGVVRRVSRAMWGYDEVTDALTIRVGPSLLVLGGLAVMLMMRSLLAGAIALVAIILFAVLNLVVTARYVRPANQRSNELDATMNATVADALAGNAVVKGFASEPRELERFAADTAHWRTSAMRTWARFVDLGIMQNLVLLLLQAGVTGMMVEAWLTGRASPGDVAFAITAFILMSGYLRNLGDNVRELLKGLDDTADALRFVQAKGEPMEENAPDLVVSGGAVAFEGVSFAYGDSHRSVFENLNLSIEAGESVAITGESGSGKSTLIKLLHRLYPLGAGRILIDGQDIARVSLSSLRRAVAVAPQEPTLFHRSIRDNIAYGRPDATLAEIEHVARIACADGFIARLPAGYDTLVGERGVTLSGGERQRIVLARALLPRTPLLILDEATSALDRETEAQVLRNLAALPDRQTRIVIAHRPASIASAGRVIQIVNGRSVPDTSADSTARVPARPSPFSKPGNSSSGRNAPFRASV